MPKSQEARRKRVTVALRKAVVKMGKRGGAATLEEDMTDWALDGKGRAFMTDRDVPSRNTTRNWLKPEDPLIGLEHLGVMERYLKDQHRDCFLTPSKEDDALSEVTRYFGQRKSLTLSEGPLLEGEWLMYRPHYSEHQSYLVSSFTIGHDRDKVLILAEDEVHFGITDQVESVSDELWDGVCITSGLFLQIFLRSVDKRKRSATNNKSLIFNRFMHGSEKTKEGREKYYRIIGKTLIGVERESRVDMFDTVLQRRTGQYRDVVPGPYDFDQLPEDMRRSFLTKNTH